jgi:hypothetical protein
MVVSKSPKPIGEMGYAKGVSDGKNERKISAHSYGQEVKGYDERGDRRISLGKCRRVE